MDRASQISSMRNRARPALWALVDCNNFYASCERLFRPDLIGRPVVVLSNNDGCIVARSNEAKSLGIKMGEPEFKVRAFLKQHNVAVFSSNYALYGDISARVMTTMESLVPIVDQYSIDEAFVPLDGTLAASADEVAVTLRERVRKWTGIIVSVGVGTTRTLAKLASEIGKKGSGVCRVDAGTAVADAILADTPVGEVWGVGRRSAEKLILRNIRTARDLRDADSGMIKQLLSITGMQTQLELRGIQCVDQTAASPARRTMVSSRSFGKKVTEKEYLAEALALYVTQAGERLRKEKLEAGGIAVHIRTSRHGDGPFYDKTVEVALPHPTADTQELIRATRTGLESAFQSGYFYAKAGVMLFDLAPAGRRQASLFDSPEQNASKQHGKKLMTALDSINRKFGRGALRFGAEGKTDAPWHMQHTKRSSRWTTMWDELPKISAAG